MGYSLRTAEGKEGEALYDYQTDPREYEIWQRTRRRTWDDLRIIETTPAYTGYLRHTTLD